MQMIDAFEEYFCIFFIYLSFGFVNFELTSDDSGDEIDEGFREVGFNYHFLLMNYMKKFYEKNRR
jgi:hypothetical protein